MTWWKVEPSARFTVTLVWIFGGVGVSLTLPTISRSALSTIFVHAVNSKPDYVGYLKEACDFCS